MSTISFAPSAPVGGAAQLMQTLIAQTAAAEQAKAARTEKGNPFAPAPPGGAARLMQTLIAQQAAEEADKAGKGGGQAPSVMSQIGQANEKAWVTGAVGNSVDTYA